MEKERRVGSGQGGGRPKEIKREAKGLHFSEKKKRRASLVFLNLGVHSSRKIETGGTEVSNK